MIVFKKDMINKPYSFRIKGRKFVVPANWYCEVPDEYYRSLRNDDNLFILPPDVMLADQEPLVTKVEAKKHIAPIKREVVDKTLRIEKLISTINKQPRQRPRTTEEAREAVKRKNEKGVDKTLEHKKAKEESKSQIKKKKVVKKTVKEAVKKNTNEIFN